MSITGQVEDDCAVADTGEPRERQAEASSGLKGPSWESSSFATWIGESPSWITSLIVHLVLLLVLACWILPQQSRDVFAQLQVTPNRSDVADFDPTAQDVPDLDIEMQSLNELTAIVSPMLVDELDVSTAADLVAAPQHVDLSEMGEQTAPKVDLLKNIGVVGGTGLWGRGEKQRRVLVKKRGGTPASEEAVSMALQWFARHQNPDGSWGFDHHRGRCQGRCRNPGSMNDAPIGATAMALLPFLGAGQTHKEGEYKKVVRAGIYFLVRSMRVSKLGGDLRDGGGRMYSHGLASIALCEAYAMTHDRGLIHPAQSTLNYISYAQDPIRGGWRYMPREGSDTSVVGWQLMALKSGHMAYLHVRAPTVRFVSKFLNSVQAKGGAAYGYASPEAARGATTAVGLLCRMYLGWKQDNRALIRGIQWMSDQGPSATDYYYNYYATQAIFQFTDGEGDLWEKWNSQMREQLVATQTKSGHAAGSWFMKDPHGSSPGGRLYCTSMATMILEIYYRHMPIYGRAATEEDFPE